MTSTNRKVAVSQRVFDQATVDYLEAAGCDVVQVELPPGEADGNLDHDTLVAMLDGAAGWIVGHARVTRELLAALPDLRVVSRRGVGYERVDLVAAAEMSKVVCIAAGGNDASVADHTIALMLAVGHRFRETQQKMIGGDWSILMGVDLYRKTVGIIGLGRIGRNLVPRLRGFRSRPSPCRCRMPPCTIRRQCRYAIQSYAERAGQRAPINELPTAGLAKRILLYRVCHPTGGATDQKWRLTGTEAHRRPSGL